MRAENGQKSKVIMYNGCVSVGIQRAKKQVIWNANLS